MIAGLGAVGLLELSLGAAPAPASVTPASLPLYFEANQGQVDPAARFVARGQNAQFLVSAVGMQIILSKPASSPIRLQMQFAGADPQAQISGEEKLAGKINYLTGNDPAQWKTGVPIFARVRVEQLYPGIGLVYYGNHRQLEYDFTIAPGADPDAIAVHFSGADRISIGPAGELVLDLGNGEIRQPKPRIYQVVNGARRAVGGGYRLAGTGTVAFSVGQYDHRLPLVIDPVLGYSTYFGGNGDDTAWAVAVDTNGFVYVAGQTTSTQFAPGKPLATTGAFQTNFQGGAILGDAFVAKLDNAGTNLIYLTYLGGSADDTVYGMALDASGDAFVAGATDSPNFPVKNAIYTNINGTINPYSHSYLADAFVAELNPGGSNLIYSTFLGGVGADAARAVALDSAGNAFVTGFTYSTNFPTTANAFQKRLGVTNWIFQAYYNANAFVAEIAAGGSNLVYSSYFGGTNYDEGRGIAVDGSGGVCVAGYTASVNFPHTNAFQNLLNGTTNANPAFDSFVAKFAPGCSNLVYSTYLGGANNDVACHLAVDGPGNAYVTGWTVSTNFPDTVTNVPNGLTNNFVYGFTVVTNAFLTQIAWNGTNAAIGYSAVFGGTNSCVDIGYGVVVDAAGNAFVVGATSATSFPTTLPTNGVGQLIATNAGASDVFVTAFNTNASALLYSVEFGGANNDYGYAIALDASTNAYIVGQTFSSNFPTNNARQPALNGSSDAFLARIISYPVPPAITIQPTNQSAAVGSTVSLVVAATGTPPLSYQWQMQETNLTWTNLVNGNGISGATNATLIFNNAQVTNSGNYQVIVANYVGSVTSSVAALTVTNAATVLTSQPASQTVGLGSTVSFDVGGTAQSPFFLQWLKNGTNLVDGPTGSGSGITGSTSDPLNITNVQMSDEGTYWLVISNAWGVLASSNAVLTVVIVPTILTQPTNQTVLSETDVSVAVSAVGEGTLHYRWQVQPTNQPAWMDVTNGGNISGATNAALSFTPALTTDSANYQVIITNNFGAVTSSVALLMVTNAPVVLTQQPISQTNSVGSTNVFFVNWQGTEVSFQWLKDGISLVNGTNGSGALISGANTFQLTIQNAQTNDIGSYSVMVSNVINSVTSSNALLEIVTYPTIIVPPTNQIAGLGGIVNFSVTAVGQTPLSYQWLMNGTNAIGGPVSGANTNDTLTLTNTQIGDSGRNFSVIVTNLVGAVTSSPPAVLTVLTAPHFASVINVGGTNFNISGVGGTNSGAYFVLTTTNVALPFTNWINRGGSFFDSQGKFNFTYSLTNVLPHEFLILQMQ